LEAFIMKKLALLALVAMLLPVGAYADTVFKDGDPATFYSFPATADMVKGETRCFDFAPTNFGSLDDGTGGTTCTGMDTFCVVITQDSAWALTDDWTAEGPFELNPGYWWPGTACITVPCDVPLYCTNTLTAGFYFTDINMVCQPDSGDCKDPNAYHGSGAYYQETTVVITIVESPPALYILQDSLFYVEQGQTGAYVPFAICNGDPCAPATDYGYSIVSQGNIGPALAINDVITGVPGGECGDVYGVLDAGTALVCTYDELTIIAWDDATGTVYDTCVQLVHVIEPVPVPLFTAPVVTILVLAMILAAAVIMKRHAVSKA
jgi:hypothetical protein